MTHLSQRLLLPLGVDEREFLFLLCSQASSSPREARFSLVAPGMERLGSLQDELLDWLKASLPNSSTTFAYNVELSNHPETGLPEIVVPVDDTYTPARKLISALYQMVVGHLTPLVTHREVVLVRENQRLMPLDLEVMDHGRTLRVALPDLLDYTRPNRPTVKYTPVPEQRKRDFLAHELDIALDSYYQITNVAVYNTTTDGTSIHILFEDSLWPIADEVRDILLEVLARHVTTLDNVKLAFAARYQNKSAHRLY